MKLYNGSKIQRGPGSGEKLEQGEWQGSCVHVHMGVCAHMCVHVCARVCCLDIDRGAYGEDISYSKTIDSMFEGLSL